MEKLLSRIVALSFFIVTIGIYNNKKNMRALVTGSSGFIGSHIVDELLSRGYRVTGVDNMSTGIKKFLESANNNINFNQITGDILDFDLMKKAINDVDIIYHMAANADIRGGTNNTKIDLEQNIIGTYNILESMRLSERAKRICFASSAAALGEPSIFPTPENLSTPIQTSLYGASKMSCEGFISAFCNAFDIEGYCFRFVSLLGPRYPHGHVFDFVKKLKDDPNELNILGDGTAEKSYLHINDCIRALMMVCEEQRPAKDLQIKYEIFNLGMEEFIEVKESAKLISSELNLNPEFIFGEGKRGWVGDNPFVFLDVNKIKALGWLPEHTITQSIKETARWLDDNQWIFEQRL